MSDEELELDKPLIIFGKDITKIPCFRSSILYGFGSGIGAALVVFMLTSKPRLASHAFVGTFACVNLTHWFICRRRYAIQKFNMGQIQGAYQRALVLDGTQQEEKLRKEVEVADA